MTLADWNDGDTFRVWVFVQPQRADHYAITADHNSGKTIAVARPEHWQMGKYIVL